MDTGILKKSIEAEAFRIIARCAASMQLQAFVIGGFVRDALLGTGGKDVDIVTDGDGIVLARECAKRLGVDKVTVYKTFGTAMFNYREWQFEFVGARKESYSPESRNPVVIRGSLHDDQLRRDFTINALAVSLQPSDFSALVDPFNGVEDLKNGIIRTPLDPDITFSDDPLRMIRAIRFATKLNFTIEAKTLEAITRNAKRIEIITRERIAEELNKILMSKKPSIGFKILDKTGLLQLIFPQLLDLKGANAGGGTGLRGTSHWRK